MEEPIPHSEVVPETGWDEGKHLLRDAARAALGSGASRLKMLAFSSATVGDRVDGVAFVPKGVCALFVARATSSVEDLDLHVYGDDGSQYGADESPDDLPTLLVCPERPTRLYASARVAQGHGLVALGVQSVPENLADQVAQSVGARNFARNQEEVQDDWPGLVLALSERRRRLGGKWLDRRRVALPVDSRVPSHLTVDVPAARCLDVLFLPSEDVTQVQVGAHDNMGRLFSRGQHMGQLRAMLFCSKASPRSLTLEVRPYAGRGLVVAALSVSESAFGGLSPGSDVEAHFVDESAPPSDHARLSPARIKHSLALERGRFSSWETTFRGCTRLDFVPDEHLLGYEAYVWSGNGDLLAQGNGHHGRPLFVCFDGSARIDVQALGRSGTLLLEVRPSPEDLPSLVALPLAASRILGQAYEEGFIRLPEEIGRVTRTEISDTRLTRLSLSIPSAHCQSVFVAGDHGTVGIEGRIVQNDTHLEMDRSHGRGALMARVCAPLGAHLDATLELRTSSGKADALWASRQTKLER